MILKRLLVVGLILSLVACEAPLAATPAPTPQAIQVYYPASAQPWADKLASCTLSYPQVALYFMQVASSEFNIRPDDIFIELGPPAHAIEGTYIAQIGWERLVVIVNQANPIVSLTGEKLAQIFSGQLNEWDPSTGRAIQVWIPPVGEPTLEIFENALDLPQQLAPDAKLAPNPTAMLEAVSKDEASIGFLPQSFLSNRESAERYQVKIIQLDDSIRQRLNQPVLAFTLNDPSGYVRDLLVCTQNTGKS
jgi:hypothetical protein